MADKKELKREDPWYMIEALNNAQDHIKAFSEGELANKMNIVPALSLLEHIMAATQTQISNWIIEAEKSGLRTIESDSSYRIALRYPETRIRQLQVG